MADIPDTLVWPQASAPVGAQIAALQADGLERASSAGGWRRRLEQAATILILFMMSSALIGPLLDPNEVGGEDNPFLRTMWLPIYGLTMVLAALQWRAMLRAWAPLILVTLLLALAWASSTWSIAPEVTGRRVMALAFTSLFGAYLGARWSWCDFVTLVALLALVLALGSYAVCIADPAMGVHQSVNAGAWRGLWFEKNAMGAVMAVGVLASVATALLRPSQRWRWSLNAALCLGLVIMSKSGTALVTIGLIVLATAGLSLMRRGPATAVATVFALGVAAFGAATAQVLAPGVFLALLGKDPTLTGRTDIWAAILRQAAARPVLGFGYAAFWEKTSAPANFVRAETGWLVPSAHNGWLDMLVQLGVAGVVVCAALLALGYLLAIIRALDGRDGGWAVIFFSIFLISSISESVLMQRNSLTWTLCIATLTKILSERAGRSGQGRGAAAPGQSYHLWPPEAPARP